MIDTELLKECKAELKVALSRFGTYQFDDKGAREVMDMQTLVEKFREKTPRDAADTLIKLAKEKVSDGRCQPLVSEILQYLDDWDELWEEVPEMSDYY